MKAYRIDRGTLRKPTRLPDGRLRADAYMTRSGVFEYRNADGSIRREYRPASEVFKADSLETFADVPVTDDHPPEMVNARNARQYTVGQVSGAPRQDGDHVAITLVVNDADTISKMEAGKVELSAGYEVDLIEGSGVAPDGQKFDAVQTNIRGNHVAIVAAGRAGQTSRVRMDAALYQITGADMDPEQMKAALDAATQRADALQAKLDAMPAALAAAAKKGADDEESDDEDEDEDEPAGKGKMPAFLKKKIAKKDAAIAKLEGQLVAAKNEARDQTLRADRAEKARTDAAAGSLAAARARISLEAKAQAVLGADFKADAADRDLMVAVVKRVDGEEIGADASIDFVRGMFQGAAKRHDAGADALAGLRLATETTVRGDADKFDDEETAARKMRERSDNAWKTTEGK